MARDAADGSQVTLYDVARLAGVSTATVSRVVHGLDRVRDSTRSRVLEVIEQLGYVPDGAAQSLSRRRKNVIGLVCVERLAPQQYDIESMSLLFYDEILRGVEARIRDHNWSLMITYLREENHVDLPRLQSLSGRVDGLLIGEGIVPSAELARLAERLPVVVVAGDPAEQAVDVVTADNRSGSVALVTHLVADHGRRRLFHVDGPPTAPDAKERLAGAQPGYRCPPRRYSRRLALRAVQRAERRGSRPEGTGQRGPAGCGRVRQRSDGDRRAPGADERRRSSARGHGRDRIRRHLPRQSVRAIAHHCSPADAPARRASLRQAPGSHRQPRSAAAG